MQRNARKLWLFLTCISLASCHHDHRLGTNAHRVRRAACGYMETLGAKVR